jgi:uncharacterized protein involved in exopolysaccharide biosynthesis
MAPDDRSVDLREVGTALRRGWPVVVAGAVLGLLLAVVGIQGLPERYEGTAKVLVRGDASANQSLLSRLGGLSDLIPGGMGMGSGLETELEILTSRSLIGQVVDSLGLQVVVTSPDAVPTRRLVSSARVPAGTRPAVYRFERRGSGFEVRGPGVRTTVDPSGPIALGAAELTLARGVELPDRFSLRVMDREDAITAVTRSLSARSVTADVAQLSFRAGDPVTAAELPNLLLAEYLVRRRTTDRGLNQTRYEFLVEHTDSIATELALAEAGLRQYQETSGVVDPTVSGRASLERAMALRGELESIDVEERALQRVVEQSAGGRFSTRDIAAYPSFLRNPAINDVLSRLLELETRRVDLLQRRTERDPDVVALTEGVEHLERQLRELSRAYLDGLRRQRSELGGELGVYRAELAQLPEQVEQSLRREREVKRLSETLVAMQTQLVQSRLLAIGEGGEVRQIDAAVPPKKPVFPQPLFLLFGGLVGGAFFGAIGAVSGGLLRQRLREPWEAELAAGVPAVWFDRRSPLALGAQARSAPGLLLLPLEGRAGRPADAVAVGQRMVETATLQGREAVLIDLSGPGAERVPGRIPTRALAASTGDADASSLVLDLPSGAISLPVYRGGANGERAVEGAHAMLAEVERRFDFAVAVLPGLDHPASVSVLSGERPVVLVARAGEVTRSQLRGTLSATERMGGTVVGVVLQPGKRDRTR